MEEFDKEVFIPLKINTRKGRGVCAVKSEDDYTITPLSKLLAKAYMV